MTRFILAVALAATLIAPAAHSQDTDMKDQIAIFMTIKTQPGQRDALISLWEEHLRPRADGNEAQTRYVIARDLADPDTIRIAEIYSDKAALEANAQTPWFADYMQAAMPLLAGEPEFHMAAPHWVK